MSSEVVIRASGLGKAYQIYDRPQDRLKQMIFRSHRFYREYWAVQNVSLEIKRGETVGIVGRNGSGKSTLLQMIAGTLQPNSGEMDVVGRVAPLLELGAGFNPEFTGRENVLLSASILGLDTATVKDREPSILEFAGIGEFVDQPVKTYSSGMFARLAFAVAAHVDADILIVDEILSVGDASFVQKCMRFIHEFKKTGTILFVSHDTAAVSALCDRAVWMDRGQVRAEGDVREVALSYQADLHGEAEGGAFSIEGRRRLSPSQPADVRHELLRNSNKRNDLEVFSFDPAAPSYGAGGARIADVQIENDQGPSSVLEGGEEVALRITVNSVRDMRSPIVGFFVKDRLGQNLFGDNTYLSFAHSPVTVQAGERFEALFRFRLPYLPEGEYSVAVAVAEGTQVNHVQQHWVEDAVIFRAMGGAHQKGLIGIPMHGIEMVRLRD